MCSPVEIIEQARNICHITFLYNKGTNFVNQDDMVGRAIHGKYKGNIEKLWNPH